MTNTIEIINHIEYYSTPASCISHFEQKPWIKKAMSAIASFGTLFMYAINRVLMTVGKIEKQMDHYTRISNLSHKRLVVCLHGLNNNPTQFKTIVDEMVQKGHLDSEIYIPKIIQKGNAKLDEMVAPILKDIAAWAKAGEKKELVLVGVSNGGRIARAIEAELINSGQVGNVKRLRFISIVGACKGSSLVGLAKKLHLSWLLSKNIAKEMPAESERFKQLGSDWERARKAAELQREYTFIASPHDWQVPNYDSSLMEIADAKVRYSIVPNHGHNSIVNAVAKSVAAIVMDKF